MIIEDDEATRQILALACAKQGYRALTCSTAKEALGRGSSPVSAIILGLGLPDMDGTLLLRELLKKSPWVPCFILTARDSARSAVECIKAGARDYFTKPVDLGRLFQAIRDSTDGVTPCAQQNANHPSGSVRHPAWNSDAGRSCQSLAHHAAISGSPLLISGESGTGRVTIARTVHVMGANHDGPLHIFNAAGTHEPCLESSLFGRAGGVEGNPVRGLLQKCADGTLVITAVEKAAPAVLAKLEEVVIGGRYQRQGSNTSIQLSCRITCVTSADLAAEAASGRFSKRLWFALRNMHIRMPSLKNRIEDLPVFCEKFLTDFCVANNTPRPQLASSTMEMLLRHHWPGNLDELRHCLETACRNRKGHIIATTDFPRYLWDPALRSENADPRGGGSARIDEVERASLVTALSLCGGNRRLAAQRLGVSLRTIYNMIRRHRISPPESGNNRHGGSLFPQ